MNKAVANINFTDNGEGTPVVLLHGFMESLEIWDEFTDTLSVDFRVIAIDLPGHGGSDCIGKEHSMEMMAEEVYNVLEILGIKKAIFIGHSMGGYVCCAFAEKYPQLMKGLVLMHSHAFPDSEEAKKNRDRLIEAVKKDKTGFIASFIPELFAPANRTQFIPEIENLARIAGQTCKDGIIASLTGMKNRPDRNKIIAALNIPVLYILGKYDSKVPTELILPAVKKTNNSVSIVLDHSGHMGYIEEKEQALEILKDFLEAV